MFEDTERNVSSAEVRKSFVVKQKFILTENRNYHISLDLDRSEPTQGYILSCQALLWPCPSKTLSGVVNKAVLHLVLPLTPLLSLKPLTCPC